MIELNSMTKSCSQSGDLLTGRSDRRFCSVPCKNQWHNAKRKEEYRIFSYSDKILHRNREILNSFCQYSSGKGYIPLNKLLQRGFDSSYYHRITMNHNGTGNNLYVVYDFAFLHDHSKGVKVCYKWMFPSLK